MRHFITKGFICRVMGFMPCNTYERRNILACETMPAAAAFMPQIPLLPVSESILNQEVTFIPKLLYLSKVVTVAQSLREIFITLSVIFA